MGKHDTYGKKVMRKAFNSFDSKTINRIVNYNDGGSANIDGVIGEKVAVEIESRASKQVRGALLDLIFHKYKKKLLVLLPVHQHNIYTTAKQCRFILGKDINSKNYRVVVLKGTGNKPQLNNDIKTIRKELYDWRLTSHST